MLIIKGILYPYVGGKLVNSDPGSLLFRGLQCSPAEGLT
jgi:hypothetical protein